MGISYSSIYANSVGTSPIKLGANPKRIGLLIVNNSSSAILYVMSGSAGNVGEGLPVSPQRSFETVSQSDLWLISDTAATDVRVCEVIE